MKIAAIPDAGTRQPPPLAAPATPAFPSSHVRNEFITKDLHKKTCDEFMQSAQGRERGEGLADYECASRNCGGSKCQDAAWRQDGGTGGNTGRFICPYRAGDWRPADCAKVPAAPPSGHVDARFGHAEYRKALTVRGWPSPARGVARSHTGEARPRMLRLPPPPR